MIKKKSLTILSLVLLLLSCGMCLLCTGCDTGDGNTKIECTLADTQFAVGADESAELSGLSVTFTFGYDITIDKTEYKKGDTITATGYADAVEKGFIISGFNTESATASGKTRTLTISYANKSCYIKYTVQ